MQASGYWISYQGNPAGKAGEEGSKKCKFKLSVDISKPPCCDVTLLFRTFSGLDWIQVLSFATANSQSKKSFFFSSPEAPGDIGTDEDLGAKKGYGVVSH